MNHFFIGSPDHQIFVSRLSSRKQPVHRAALLFYPYGQEYMRAHKAFRQLATLLSRKDIDVYRFDYPGSGDSYGDAEQICYRDYCAAAQAVLSEISDPYSQIDLIGLRFGALVASNLAKNNSNVKNLVLWDPYPSGKAFIDDIKQLARGSTDQDKSWNVHGYEVSPAFRTTVSEIDICSLLQHCLCKTHLLLSAETKQSKHLLEGIPSQPNQVITGPENDWNFVDMVGSILMPTELIKSIVKTISEH